VTFNPSTQKTNSTTVNNKKLKAEKIDDIDFDSLVFEDSVSSSTNTAKET